MAGAQVLPSSIRVPAEARLKLFCPTARDRPASTSSSSLPSRVHLRSPALPRSSFFAWDARSHLGSRIETLVLLRDWLRLPKRRTQGIVHASLLGVGAPEALVIAVVALLVFGPKGLAEVARTLGKSLRAFQPTIQELQQISRDFKDTLEQEIGLDEMRGSQINRSQSGITSDKQPQPASYQNGPVEQKPYSTEDYVNVTEEQIKALVPEEQRKAAEAAAWGGFPPPNVNKDTSKEGTRDSEAATNNLGPPQ